MLQESVSFAADNFVRKYNRKNLKFPNSIHHPLITITILSDSKGPIHWNISVNFIFDRVCGVDKTF